MSKLDYAASGGIHSPEGLVKDLLAGASAVEMCSAIYQQTPAIIAKYNDFLKQWMEGKGLESIAQFKGRLNLSDPQGVNTFERTQFLKYFASHE